MSSYQKWGLIIITGSVAIVSFYNLASLWVTRKSQKLVKDILDNQAIQLKTTEVTNKMVQHLLTDESLLEISDRALQKRIQIITTDEIILNNVIVWIENFLVDPRVAEKSLIFLNNFMTDEKNKILLINLCNNILSDPELIKTGSKYLEGVLRHPTVLKAVEDGLTASVSNGLKTDSFISSSSDSLKSIVSKTTIPQWIYDYIKARQ